MKLYELFELQECSKSDISFIGLDLSLQPAAVSETSTPVLIYSSSLLCEHEQLPGFLEFAATMRHGREFNVTAF